MSTKIVQLLGKKSKKELQTAKKILSLNSRKSGYRNVNNILRYTQLIKTEDDEFISKVAKTVKEAFTIVDAIYTYVTEFREKGMAPPDGLEPSTHELTARCST